MKKKPKKKSLIARVMIVSLILGAAAMLISGVVLYMIFLGRAEDNLKETLKSQIGFMEYPIIKYAGLDWLMSYWQEHYEEMDLPPFENIENYVKWANERGKFRQMNVSALTAEDIRKMSGEEQRLFAEYCYLELFLELSVQRQQSVDIMSCFIPDETKEEAFACFRCTDEGKGLLDLKMVLGEKWDFHPEEHPKLMALYGQESMLESEVEVNRSLENGTDYATVYSLLVRDRKVLGVVSVSMSMKEMIEGVWSDVFRFEKWVALTILIAIITILYTVYRIWMKPTLSFAQDVRTYTQNRSVEKLSESLQSLISRRDEIGMLAEDVRIMVEQNEQYYQQQLENEKLKTKILIAQIKPHFIYNCLNVICSYIDEPQKVEEALNHFAGFLRGSAAILEETHCISADREFRTVDDYLYMQKLRFEDQLCVITDYRDRDFFLPAFSIQMLVENAVNHGIRATKDGMGTIRIRSYESNGFHVIEVEDDGAGISVNEPETPESGEQIHVGLRNVEERLKIMCRGTLTLISEEGKGTVATIRIPDGFGLE